VDLSPGAHSLATEQDCGSKDKNNNSNHLPPVGFSHEPKIHSPGSGATVDAHLSHTGCPHSWGGRGRQSH
jgi:hypothetical protein